MQKNRLNHAEDRRIRAHAQSQRQNRHNRKRRRSQKLPHSISQVFKHGSPSPLSIHTQDQSKLFTKQNAEANVFSATITQ
jgi:hypothetical protein